VPPSIAQESVEILDSTFKLRLHDKSLYVIAIGQIRNNGEQPLKDIILEARYFDAEGKLIDASVESLYSIVVPAKEQVAFKMQTFAADESSTYASHEVRIVRAKEDRPCPSTANTKSSGSGDLWTKTFIRWSPLFLLVLVWMVIARKYIGANSPQSKMVDLMERQIDLVEEQNKEIARLADAAEGRSRRDGDDA